jgi:hypothetical protein
MTKLSGGGLTSNKLVSTRNPKAEPTSYAISPNRPSEIGLSHHYLVKPLQGNPYSNPIGPSPSVAGPGGGRTVMRAGSQSATPNPTPRTSGRSLFK